jgi:hypothetical protein
MPDTSLYSILAKIKDLRDAIADAPDPATFVYPEHIKKKNGVMVPCCAEDTPTGVMEQKGLAALQAISNAGDMSNMSRKQRDAIRKLHAAFSRYLGTFWVPRTSHDRQEWIDLIDEVLAAFKGRKPKKKKTDDDYRREIIKVLDDKGYDIKGTTISNAIEIRTNTLYRILKTIPKYTGKKR